MTLEQLQQLGIKLVRQSENNKVLAYKNGILRDVNNPEALGINIASLPDIGVDRPREKLLAAGINPDGLGGGGAISAQDLIQSVSALSSDTQIRASEAERARISNEQARNTPNIVGPDIPNSGTPLIKTSTLGSRGATISPPNVNLQPGTTGEQVKQLQDYLVSVGYMTQAQVDTGYGTYGPKTTSAVKKLQQDLGVDNSTGPGYWGPRTIQAINVPQTGQTPPTGQTGNTGDPLEGDTRVNSAGQQEFYNPMGEWQPVVSPEQAMGTESPQPQEQSTPTQVSKEVYDRLISLDPFLQEQFKDATLKAMFDGLPQELQLPYLQMLQSLGKSIESGKVVNPDIEITTEKLKEFRDQAVTELDPYYQEQIGLIKKDLDTSLSRIGEDYTRNVGRSEEPFKETLANQAESEAQAGTAFSSERGNRERKLVLGQQNLIDDALRQSQRQVEDIGTTAERTIGSSALGNLASTGLNQYGVSPTGFTQGARKIAFAPQGGLIGTLPKEREVAVQGRSSALEEVYRRNRILDLSRLS